MISTSKALRLQGPGGPIRLQRSAEGVVRIQADSSAGLAFGLGFAHAHDRLVQMCVVRLVGQGRLSECLRASPESLGVDIALRRLGMSRDAEWDVENLTPEAAAWCDSYSAGVNHCLERRRRPFELLLAGYRPEPWRPPDTLLTVKLLSYLGLAEEQQAVEKWIAEAVIAGVDMGRLRELFHPHLEGFDPRWLQGVSIGEPFVPSAVRWLAGVPRFVGSNNWAVSGSRSASGFPLLCNDPHLEVNRLPAVWYEAVLELPDDYQMGATMPGVPGVILGRTRRVALGLTYGFADLVDHFVEDCKDGAFRRGQDWLPFDARTELVLRKGAEPLQLTIHENLHGVLEGDPRIAGRYLCRAWTGHRDGASDSLNALAALPRVGSALEAMDILSRISLSGNWLAADRDGNIGWQQSARVPLRAAGWSGLYPVPGWDAAWDWQGFAAPETLGRIVNPPEGFLATANEDRNQPGSLQAINLPMSGYRVQRIRELLLQAPRATLDDMGAMHRDLVSAQALRFLEALRPVLPDTPRGRRLAAWNGVYGADSVEAAWFEAVYHRLKREVFGKNWLGEDVWRHLLEETGLVACFHGHFDEILLEGGAGWFGAEGREALLRRVAAEVLADAELADEARPWGARHRLLMANIFFQGKLPRLLGFDHGPIALPGSRATIPQAAIFRTGGRLSSFAPSWRMLADLGEDALHTNLAGGPSGHRFSRWYKSDVDRWLRCSYKALRPGRTG